MRRSSRETLLHTTHNALPAGSWLSRDELTAGAAGSVAGAIISGEIKVIIQQRNCTKHPPVRNALETSITHDARKQQLEIVPFRDALRQRGFPGA
jgi:hypothetical protein